MERTLAILKPDCVRRGLVGHALTLIEAEGFAIKALRMTWLSDTEARTFYAVHREKSFFEDLIAFMTSGPCIVAILEREDAIGHWRRVLEGFRAEHSSDLTENLLHGSDGPETSTFERGYLFRGCEVY